MNMDKRAKLASIVCQGLSAWFKYQICTGAHELSGEDSAQLVVADLIRSTSEIIPLASSMPPNWEESQKRVDLGLIGRYTRPNDAGKFKSWIGAVEVKWLGSSANTVISRASLLADVVRLSSIVTQNINAKFLVVGGFKTKFDAVFDHSGQGRTKTESQRKVFQSILKHNLNDHFGRCELVSIFKEFTNTAYALPFNLRSGVGSISADLLAAETIHVETFAGPKEDAQFFVWQCNKVPGRPSKHKQQA
ncbi:MAG: hypothetical protein JSS08_09175 [Proteobacteria bacterium]|nr:hypothetical protein [Pseudomonadota bacterium]